MKLIYVFLISIKYKQIVIIMLKEILPSRKDVNLTKDELYLLRFMTHDYSVKQIKDFFNINGRDILILYQSIKTKLKAKSRYMCIVNAFHLNILNEYDYVNDIDKKICLEIAELIFNKCSKTSQSLRPNIVEEALNELLSIYSLALKNNKSYANLKMLTNVEKKYINKRLMNDINPELNGEKKATNLKKTQNRQTFNIINRSILTKLKVNSAYAAYNEVVALHVIDKTNFLEKRTLEKTKECKKAILYELKLKKPTEKIKTYKIYRELVSLISDIYRGY